MRKICLYMYFLLLAVSLVACNGSILTPNKNPEQKEETEEETKVSRQCTVVLMLDDEKDFQTITVKEGELLHLSLYPLKGGFNLSGWVNAADGSTFNIDADCIYDDMILVAQWTYKDYSIGDVGPAGGIIFYISDDIQSDTFVNEEGLEDTYEWKYLEVSKSDISIISNNEEINTFVFGYFCDKDGNPVATINNIDGIKDENAHIGEGRLNTTLLAKNIGSVAYCNSSCDSITTPNYAAKLCYKYSSNGYNDWFLPSQKEFIELFKNRKIGNYNLVGDYWTSSEKSENIAYAYCGHYDDPTWFYRGSKLKVRPIRAF